MERDYAQQFVRDMVKNFNSHAHVERDVNTTLPVTNNQISTHTLTWSVTCKDDTVRIAGENFNSHAHVERDSGVFV